MLDSEGIQKDLDLPVVLPHNLAVSQIPFVLLTLERLIRLEQISHRNTFWLQLDEFNLPFGTGVLLPSYETYSQGVAGTALRNGSCNIEARPFLVWANVKNDKSAS